jgi:hypothetical protein
MRFVYSDLLRYARRVSKRADEAEDIVQSVLLAAVIHGRADLDDERNRRWLMGAIRKHAMFVARSAARRRKRETAAVRAARNSQTILISRGYAPPFPRHWQRPRASSAPAIRNRKFSGFCESRIPPSASVSWKSGAGCVAPGSPPTIFPASPVRWHSACYAGICLRRFD